MSSSMADIKCARCWQESMQFWLITYLGSTRPVAYCAEHMLRSDSFKGDRHYAKINRDEFIAACVVHE